MERLLQYSVALWIVLSTGRSFGQGTFYFANYISGGLVNAPVFNSDGSPLSCANYVAMLYGGPTADSLSPAVVGLTTEIMRPVPFTSTVNGQGGYFFFTDSPGYVQVPNTKCTVTISLVAGQGLGCTVRLNVRGGQGARHRRLW